MYKDAVIEAAIREAVFTMTTKMSGLLRESIANGDVGEILMAGKEFETRDMRAAFLSITTSASHSAFSSFLNELRKKENTEAKKSVVSSAYSESVESARSIASMFANPKNAVLDEEAIKNTFIGGEM